MKVERSPQIKMEGSSNEGGGVSLNQGGGVSSNEGERVFSNKGGGFLK